MDHLSVSFLSKPPFLEDFPASHVWWNQRVAIEFLGLSACHASGNWQRFMTLRRLRSENPTDLAAWPCSSAQLENPPVGLGVRSSFSAWNHRNYEEIPVTWWLSQCIPTYIISIYIHQISISKSLLVDGQRQIATKVTKSLLSHS